MPLPLEIERKFLIRMPDAACLAAQEGVRIQHMTQTYLLAPAGVTARVRRIREDARVTYVRTEKRRLSEVTADRRDKHAQLAKEIPSDTLPPENEHA